MRHITIIFALFTSITIAACDGGPDFRVADAGPLPSLDAEVIAPDAGVQPDLGSEDAGPAEVDAGRDAGARADAGPIRRDSGPPPVDSGPSTTPGCSPDAWEPDDVEAHVFPRIAEGLETNIEWRTAPAGDVERYRLTFRWRGNPEETGVDEFANRMHMWVRVEAPGRTAMHVECTGAHGEGIYSRKCLTGTWTAGACDIEGRDDVYLEWDPPTTGADCWVDVERSDIPTERTSYSTCGYFERLGNGLTES